MSKAASSCYAATVGVPGWLCSTVRQAVARRKGKFRATWREFPGNNVLLGIASLHVGHIGGRLGMILQNPQTRKAHA